MTSQLSALFQRYSSASSSKGIILLSSKPPKSLETRQGSQNFAGLKVRLIGQSHAGLAHEMPATAAGFGIKLLAFLASYAFIYITYHII